MDKNRLRETNGLPEVIVSMTSFPARIKTVHQALQSVIDQIVKPDRIVLCLARDEFPGGREDLPPELLRVIDHGVELLWAEHNLKPHKKYFYTMRKYPDAIIITADDDKVYPQSFVGELVASYRRFPKCVSAFRAHLMTFGPDGEVLPYLRWKNSCAYFINRPNLALFAVGAGGILYPPHLLHENLFDKDGLLSTTLNNDDIWLKIMEVANRIPVVIPSAAGDRAVTIEGSQESALYNANKNGNDGMIRAAWNYFSEAFCGSVSEIIREGRLAPVPEDIDHAISECHEVQQLLSVQKSRANKAIADYYAVQEQLKQEKDHTARLTADMAQCVQEKIGLARTNESISVEVAKLREQLDRVAAECAELAKGKAVVEAGVARQREQLDQTAAECAKLAKGKAAVEAEAARQMAQCVKLEDGNRTLSDRLAVLTKKANRAASDYAKMKSWYQRVQQKYEKLSKAKLGRLTLSYWELKDGFKRWLKGDRKKIPTVKWTPGKLNLQSINRENERMPNSNGGRYYGKCPLRIGLICDRFYYDSVISAADFVYLSPDDWESKIDALDVFLVVSTWNGINDNEWAGLQKEGSKKRDLLNEIIDRAKARKIPVVFYSKEDPPHYEDYLGTARRCDWIFTTAAEVVDRYKADCGHDRVCVMRFGIDPVFHNPVGSRRLKKLPHVIFSGSWMRKFAVRCKELAAMFDGVLDAHVGLTVIDRFFDLHSDERYAYPDKYFRYCHPAVDHDKLQKLHKRFDWAININTVKDSQTMFANRGYELQAAGNLLLSNYSIGVNSLLPMIQIAHSREEVPRIVGAYGAEETYERQMASVRFVMTGQTCHDRLAEMLSAIGSGYTLPVRSVLVIASDVTPRVEKMFADQTYPNKVLMSAAKVKAKQFDQVDVVAFWDAEAAYGVFYLEDMINGFKYTDSDYITKAAHYADGKLVPGVEHDYISVLPAKSRTVFWRTAYTLERLMKLEDGDALPNGYSIDHFNFDSRSSGMRPLDRPNVRRTWFGLRRKGTFKISVIIPIYNNGWHLYGKAFSGLLRSSIFSEMEIILVDDGSTDGFTPKMLHHLEASYSNVRVYEFGDGGSGSASRPRNKGVEMATAPYVVYLDPDDEPISDGYARLFTAAADAGADVAVGDFTIASDTVYKVALGSRIATLADEGGNLPTGRELIVKLEFPAIRLHALLICREMLVRYDLQQVVGAFGEDTLFSYQVFGVAKKIVTVPVSVQVYYGRVSSSVVNHVDETFFGRYLKTANAYSTWLRANRLEAEFMRVRFALYVKSWLFQKLRNVSEDDRYACCLVLYKVLSVYAELGKIEDATVQAFLDCCLRRDYSAAYVAAAGEKEEK